MENLTKIHSERVREGSLVWINLNTSNPQKYADDIRGYVNSIVSLDTFRSKDYGVNTILKITIDNNDEPSNPITGYLKEVIQY